MNQKEIEKLKKKYPIQTGLKNKILRKKSKDVKGINKEIKQFWLDLMELLRIYDGVWLAAPQIWVNKNIIAITQWERKSKRIDLNFEEILINPKIIYMSEKTQIDEEWCLSLPWEIWKVERSSHIIVSYQNINWETKKIEANWENAVIIQHEIDHLNWILFLDKII